MSNSGPSVIESVKLLQEHAIDYGSKCRNACYSGMAANWGLLVTSNIHPIWFILSCACLLSALALDISVSAKGMQILIERIVEAQEKAETKIRFSADEAVGFAKRAQVIRKLVYAGFVVIALGFLVGRSWGQVVP